MTDPHRWALVAATTVGALGVALVLLAASMDHGLAVTPDSVSYLRAADDLAAGRSPSDATGAPFVGWPPLYPALLAAAELLTGQGAAGAARVVNTALVVTLLAVFAGAVRRLVGNRSLRLVGIGALALAPPVLAMAGSALSELLFSVCVLSCLWAVAESRRSDSWRLLVAAAGLAAAASLTKYVGVVVIGVGAGSLLPHRRRAVAFTTVASLPLGLWLLHNRFTTRTWTGPRHGSDTPVGSVVRSTAEIVGRWLAPGNPIPVVAGALMAVLVVWALVRATRRRRAEGASPLPFCLFVVAYPVALVLLSALLGFDPVGHRLLAPVWPPLVLVVLIAVDDGLTAGLDSRGEHRQGILLGAAAIWMLAAGLGVARDAHHLAADGGGYGSSRWDDSALIDATTALSPSATVASNAPYPLAFRTGRPALGADEAPPGAHLAWFDDPERSRTTPGAPRSPAGVVADRIGRELRLERVVDDGRLFLVVRRTPDR